MKDRLICFKEGAIHCTEPEEHLTKGHVLNKDNLGNPMHALLSPYAQDKRLAALFLGWALFEDGGQKVIKSFVSNGMQLNELSPHRMAGLGMSTGVVDSIPSTSLA